MRVFAQPIEMQSPFSVNSQTIQKKTMMGSASSKASVPAAAATTNTQRVPASGTAASAKKKETVATPHGKNGSTSVPTGTSIVPPPSTAPAPTIAPGAKDPLSILKAEFTAKTRHTIEAQKQALEQAYQTEHASLQRTMNEQSKRLEQEYQREMDELQNKRNKETKRLQDEKNAKLSQLDAEGQRLVQSFSSLSSTNDKFGTPRSMPQPLPLPLPLPLPSPLNTAGLLDDQDEQDHDTHQPEADDPNQFKRDPAFEEWLCTALRVSPPYVTSRYIHDLIQDLIKKRVPVPPRYVCNQWTLPKLAKYNAAFEKWYKSV
jgi:hypothetical protein